MRFSDFVAASLAAAPFVAAHGDAGVPKIFGMPKHLKTREFLSGQKNVATPARSPRLQSRQGGTADGRCGASFNGVSCNAGYCCSAEGYCGNTNEHCAAPDCQINYGPGCDANQTPAGSSTRNDARPQLGNIEYGGVGIRSCLKPKTVAITYDDGPYIYTTEVMDMFKQYNAKATFFITGNNIGKGAIDTNWRGVIQDMYARGHQIASHTWSHQNLDQITSAQRYDQMVKNEMALRNILGKYPTYMRPPYSACDSAACQADLKALGYVITSFDLDTDDYNQLTTEKIETAKANFKAGIDSAKPNGDQLAIAHDIHELTARNLTPYMLKYVYDNGFTAVTVGECMGDPEANWYRDSTPAPLPSSSASASASASSSAPVPTPTGPTSTNGACGTANVDGKGQSCVGFVGPDGLSECCSQYGYCGRSNDYCQTGCNPLFGKCGTQPSVVPSASASVTATSSAPVPTVSLPTSPDAQCGATAGYTCKGFTIDGVKVECCSQYNYCGNTEAYCGTGCNPLYGNCGISVSSSIASSSASSSAPASSKASSSAVSTSAPVSSKASSSAVSSSTPVSSKASSSAVSSSAPVSSKASSSAVSSSAPVSSKASSSAVSSSAPASSKASSVASVSASASVSKSASASASPSISSKASSSVASASASVSKSDSASVKPSSVSASPSVSKPASSSGSASPSVSKPASSGATSYSVTIPQVSSTPAPSSKPASSSAQPSVSTPASKPASSSPAPSSGGVYPGGSTIQTVVKPSSTPCTTSSSASPTPSKPVTSKDGKCGKDNGGQTCAGYKNGFGWKIECCCKESGRCSTDPWACGIGCDKAYGNCWF